MKNISKTAGLFFSLLALTACSTQNLFKVDPLDEKVVYNGREIVTKENEEVSVSVEFDGQSENDFVFYVHLKNISDDTVLVTPRDIFAEVLKKDLSEIDERFGLMRAIDPEIELTQISKEKENRKTMHGVTTGLNAAFALVSIIADLSDNNKHNDGHKVVRDVAVWADNQIREEIDYNESVKHLESQKEFWGNEVLRNTDLLKDDEVGGLVFIPFNPNVKYMRLVIPIGNTDFEFYFKQVKID